jgi:hypothetical protein
MADKTGDSDQGASTRRSGQEGREGEETFREADDTADHQANANQVRDEPVPASHHEDPRQEAVVRNEEHSQSSEGRR